MSAKFIDTPPWEDRTVLSPVMYVTMAGLGLVFDLNMPLGVAGGVPYVALVIMGLWSSRRVHILYLAIIASILTLAGYFLSPPGGILWVVFTNRLLALFVIWAAAIVIYHYAGLMDSQRKMASAIEQSSVGIFITDIDGIIEYANPKVFSMSGFDKAEVIGSNPNIFKSGLTSNEIYEDLWVTIIAGRHWRGEVINKYKSGGYYWGKLQIFPVRDKTGKIKNFVAIIEDVTERKRSEEKLILAMQDAENANQAKSSFLANMSHEFRTPLNAILGFAETIKMEILGPLKHDKYSEYIDHIYDSAQHLMQLVEEILDLSKIESGRQDINEKKIDVADLIMNCLALVNEQARKAEVNIDGKIEEMLPPLLADERMTKQVLLNLLSNAIKFTAKGGAVKLRAFLSGDGHIKIVASDTGIGISREDYEKVFSVFGQAESILTRSHEGSGLGLPISRRLIELHGGTLDLESVLGEGTIVTITFPTQRTAYQTDQA